MPERLVRPAGPLRDERVVLRRWRVEDLPDVHLGMQDPEVPRWTRIPEGNPPHEVRRYLDGQPRAQADGAELVFALADPVDDRFLGSISLLRVVLEEHRAEVGYWLAPWGRGRGVLTSALRLLSRWALTDGGFARLELRIDQRNAPSLAVGERAGYVREGVMRSVQEHRGERIDLVLLSLLPSDLPSAPAPGRAPSIP
ncbi:GNAT family N-acetyltransferase [Paraconexibacter algicola]|uniref:GNAT family N-acetyltransferase n=1 Tax=Paraconexibacter algicola TaxID=2133960 RepID=UPI0013047DD3|nr:GNAT family N-acetyltransferase [Paraconexibacter algicola]